MGDYDVTTKVLIRNHPGDWLRLAGMTVDGKIELVDTDLSTVSLAADKLLRIVSPSGPTRLVHLETQSGYDSDLDGRMLGYNVAARRATGESVRSVAFLLRPEADGPRITGGINDVSDPDAQLIFSYRIVRVARLAVESLLTGGIGTLPLAPIARVDPAELPAVVDRMKLRVESELSPAEAAEFWATTTILFGLRHDKAFARVLFSGVKNMRESSTYMEILDLGKAEGRTEGRTEGWKEGRAEGQERGIVLGLRESVLDLGTAKFGPPSPALRDQLQAIADHAELHRLVLRILPAGSWEELFDSGAKQPH